MAWTTTHRRVGTAGAVRSQPMSAHRRLVGALLVVGALVGSLLGCSSKGTKVDTAVTLVPQNVLAWTDAGGGVDIAQLIVPRDHASPDGATISLYVARHRATDPKQRIGTLLVNPGGPGAAGSVLAEQADKVYSSRLLARFDIVGWDPRGVGRSEPAVDCVDDLDPLFSLDVTPDSPADTQALDQGVGDFVAGCETRSGGMLAYMSTEQSARDIESLRAALGEARVSYFGFSYGSELGATWLTLYPDTVRAAVLDGAIDPRRSATDETVQQAAGFERALDAFLARCAGDKKCALYSDGNPQRAFADLMARLDATPVPTSTGRPPVSSGVAALAVAQAMYASSAWPRLERALADARDGHGLGLLALYDQYLGRDRSGAYDNTLEAFFATSCLDDDATSIDHDALARRLAEAAPQMGPLWQQPDVCEAWPIPAQPSSVVIDGAKAPPVVVVGTTGDPATPLEASRGMAEALHSAMFVTVKGSEHTGYGLNDCIDGAVDGYLIDLAVPAVGTTC